MMPGSGIENTSKRTLSGLPQEITQAREGVVWCDVIHGHAGGADETVLRIRAIFYVEKYAL